MHTHSKQSKHRGLKLVSQSALLSLLILSTQAFAAGTADPVTMANKAGFTNCNSLIRDIFRFSKDAQEMRTNTRYNSENVKETIDIDMAFGKPGDTIVQSTHFERRGGMCYAYSTISFNQQGSCVGIMSKDENKYVGESAGTIWAKNKLGAMRVMTQTGDVCSSIFFASNQMKQDRY
ncbi:hypothetical protein [Klebsiella quasipneumoniae]|uniref:hypothetical protein n=1 Tax=Klebsiella quasipneumoniae TaxID=1463165 RepID=UPI0015D473F0|nr:hypothetical protein [Klebsiella quasipneumoniae]